jgi:uncharacterized protein YbbC (DUF1343 family)
MFRFILLSLLSFFISSCSNAQQENKIKVGAERTNEYFPLIASKLIAVTANQTTLIQNTHLVDSLLSAGFSIKKAFGPEHGFRGNAADGVEIKSGTDPKTGIPIISLYGNHKKPTSEDLEGIDLVIFDIQDVGARFYTYITTMTYIMEACAENKVSVIILDRPNPHGDYVDGPVLNKAFSSFIGLHEIPVVHGMTIGEYAQMVNGEGWLKNGVKCDLTVIPCANYDHNTINELPIAPSPNLPNNIAIQLYPSLCFFEGTIISVGRGTENPFQVIGHPDFAIGSYSFTPVEIPGVAKNPKFEGEACFGQSLEGYAQSELAKERRLHLNWLIDYYNYFKDRDEFFTAYFKKLAGTDQLQKQIEQGLSEEEIRKSWENDLANFMKIRKKYLLYPDSDLLKSNIEEIDR